MANVSFRIDPRAALSERESRWGARCREYQAGEYAIPGFLPIDVMACRKRVGSFTALHFKCRSPISYRRLWRHIQDDPSDLVLVWLVRQGRLCISGPKGVVAAAAGEVVVAASTSPFEIECVPDSSHRFETLHLSLPAHIYRNHVVRHARAEPLLVERSREFVVADTLLRQAIDSELSDALAGELITVGLKALAEPINRKTSTVHSISPQDRRLQEVLRYIDSHLSDPDLSVEAVTTACDISPRYLSALLRRHGKPFSQLVWGKRMEAAYQWLGQGGADGLTVAEVAFRLGFKSSAHFSRMFKRVYEVSPSDFRLAGVQAPGGQLAVLGAAGHGVPVSVTQ